MEIKRDSYLEQLKVRKDNGMIKVITGIRRCGKSFLLFVLFKKYLLESGVDNDHIIEIALDGIENEELRDPKKCYRHINSVPQRVCISAAQGATRRGIGKRQSLRNFGGYFPGLFNIIFGSDSVMMKTIFSRVC